MDPNTPAQQITPTTTQNPQNPVVTPLASMEEKPAFMAAEQQTPPTTIPPNEVPPTPTSSGSGSGNMKKIAAVLGIVLLVAATGTGVVVMRNSQVSQTQAWDCNKYNFSVSRDGVVTVINGSTDNVPPHKTTVMVENSQVGDFDVPALSPGQSSTLGQVTVPVGGNFSWQVNGSANCADSGSYKAETVSAAQCTGISAFSVDWDPISPIGLASLKAGEKVRFVVSANAVTGSVDKVRFIVNGETLPEVTTTKPGTTDFYDEYTIPKNITKFSVTAQVHNQTTDAWY